MVAEKLATVGEQLIALACGRESFGSVEIPPLCVLDIHRLIASENSAGVGAAAELIVGEIHARLKSCAEIPWRAMQVRRLIAVLRMLEYSQGQKDLVAQSNASRSSCRTDATVGNVS